MTLTNNPIPEQLAVDLWSAIGSTRNSEALTEALWSILRLCHNAMDASPQATKILEGIAKGNGYNGQKLKDIVLLFKSLDSLYKRYKPILEAMIEMPDLPTTEQRALTQQIARVDQMRDEMDVLNQSKSAYDTHISVIEKIYKEALVKQTTLYAEREQVILDTIALALQSETQTKEFLQQLITEMPPLKNVLAPLTQSEAN